MSRLRFRPVAVVLLMLHLAGCYTWTPAPADIRETLDAAAPKSVRVTTTDGALTVVKGPRIMNDSLIAVEQVCRTSVAAGGRTICQEDSQQVAAVDDVTLVELRKTNRWMMAALWVILPVALVALMLCGGSGSSGPGMAPSC